MAAASVSIARFLKSAALLAATLTLTAAAKPALAANPLSVFGTGENLSPGDRDSNWKLVAAPSDFTPPEPIPYNSYVVNRASQTVGGNTYQFISVSSDSDTGINYGVNRYWIFAQTVSIVSPGQYSLNLQAEADNGLELFMNGSIDSITDPTQPTITGGTSIGSAGLGSLSPIAAVINLQAGPNTLYARLYDYGSPTGFILIPYINTSEVPAPFPLFGAAAAFGASRRLKRRLRLARPAATAGVGQSAPERV